jgi:hypothetical protein
MSIRSLAVTFLHALAAWLAWLVTLSALPLGGSGPRPGSSWGIPLAVFVGLLAARRFRGSSP